MTIAFGSFRIVAKGERVLEGACRIFAGNNRIVEIASELNAYRWSKCWRRWFSCRQPGPQWRLERCERPLNDAVFHCSGDATSAGGHNRPQRWPHISLADLSPGYALMFLMPSALFRDCQTTTARVALRITLLARSFVHRIHLSTIAESITELKEYLCVNFHAVTFQSFVLTCD